LVNGYIDICQIDYVSNIILSVSHQEKVKIFYRCSDEDKLNVFFKILYSFELIDNESKLMVIKNFLNLSKEFAIKQYDKIVAETIKHCTAYFNLNLWLEDYHEILDFHNYKLYTITLSPEDQKKFVKKVLKYIHEERVNISIEDFTSINLIDFETSKLLEQIDSSHFDYSTSIILNVILELKRQTNLGTRKDVTLAQHRIYDLILNQINKPKDILQISGFFDECEGRCSISVVEIKNEEGEILERQITYDRNIHNKVKYHPICDGRKAVHKLTNDSIPSEEKIDFWWCANQKCYKPSRILHDSNEWEKYSLLDFLTILKVNFRESDLEIYLSLINKANRFLKHLNCRECKHILYPKGRTAYAFYGVNKFICKEETCSQKDNEIYLSHCLNGYCDMEVDSRDSVKCKPVGLDSESCGWYVCNYCHSCCSTEQLLNRKWVHDNILFSEYKCHLEGHRNLGIVSCKKCGDSMESNEANKEEYERILNWFVLNKDKSKRIHKSGKTKKDKWWFTINRGNDSIQEFRKKLTKYHQVGFQIPDIEEDKNFQLIFEPIDFKKHSKDILTCKNCGCILDLSNDLAKARAIKKFHKVKFVPQPIV